ncbi:MAG: hypothetical protein NTY63_00145 [Candidatus Bipolaricaulota bacterium]|nr:hypothetical protein [Candidatus Bipolaricaulota bacterium]
MYDTHLIHSAAARWLIEDRLDEAERLRQVHRAELQRKAWLRVKRAVELGLRDGLDQGELAHELSTRLGEGVRN